MDPTDSDPDAHQDSGKTGRFTSSFVLLPGSGSRSALVWLPGSGSGSALRKNGWIRIRIETNVHPQNFQITTSKPNFNQWLTF
jgi:hypothetical protein